MIFYCVVITVLPPGSKNLTLFLFLCFVEDDILNIYFVMRMCAYTLVCVCVCMRERPEQHCFCLLNVFFLI